MFSELMALVHDRSSEKRTVLFRMISDLFTEDADMHSNRELLLFGDVLARLLDQVTLEDRASFSERIAHIPSTPRVVALKLADDEHRVAAPVLQHSPALTEGDLIDLAMRKGNEHRVAIALRSDLGEAVTEVLVDHGDGEVLSTVSGNQGARFSQRSMTILTERATTSQRLAEALATRSDLPAATAETLLRLIGPSARARLEALMKADESSLSKLMGEASREMTEVRAGQARNRIEVQGMVEAIRAGRRDVSEALGLLLDQKRPLDVAYLFAELTGVPEAHVNAVMFKLDSQPMAVLARAAGLNETVYQRICKLRCEKLNLGAAQAGHMLSIFGEMTAAEADKALEYHRKRRGTLQQKAS